VNAPDVPAAIPPVRVWSRAEMMKRVAKFSDLKGFSDGLQDSGAGSFKRRSTSIGAGERGQGGVNSPVGRRHDERRDQDLGGLTSGSEVQATGRVDAQPRHERDPSDVGGWLVVERAAAHRSLEVGHFDTISLPLRAPLNITPGDLTPSTCCSSSSATRRVSSPGVDALIEAFERTGRCGQPACAAAAPREQGGHKGAGQRQRSVRRDRAEPPLRLHTFSAADQAIATASTTNPVRLAGAATRRV
jgi:hypothetical protein